MPKSITSALADHLNLETTTLATIWTITRTDGEVFRFTDHDSNITVGGFEYKASIGYDSTAVENSVGLSVDNLDVRGIMEDESLNDLEIRAGKFDFADIRIALVNYEAPDMGELALRRGKLGETVVKDTGEFQTELRGLTQQYSQNLGNVYTPSCRADLGDSKCKVGIAPPIVGREMELSASPESPRDQGGRVAYVYSGFPEDSFEAQKDTIFKVVEGGVTSANTVEPDTTPGAQTTDGGVIVEAEESWKKFGTVTSVTDDRVFAIDVSDSRAVDDWFKFGAVEFETGDNAGMVYEVRAWVAETKEVTLFLPAAFSVQEDDRLTIYPGCGKLLETFCRDKFSNVLNFRGEPFVPGQDALLQVGTRQ